MAFMPRSEEVPRDELAPQFIKKSLIEFATHSGLGQVVAALLK